MLHYAVHSRRSVQLCKIGVILCNGGHRCHVDQPCLDCTVEDMKIPYTTLHSCFFIFSVNVVQALQVFDALRECILSHIFQVRIDVYIKEGD